MKQLLLPLLLALFPASALAAGSAAGRAYAAGEAAGRLPGAALVEIEGFADDAGGIPCGKKAYSSTWHYKFYSPASQAWVLANACGSFVLNSANHIPSRASAAPREPLPAALADSSAVAEALKKDGLFTEPSAALDRDLYMRAAWLPEEGARPAGCYWEVSRGREKAYLDCAGLKRYAAAAGGGSASAGAKRKVKKGGDGAAKYYKVLTEAAAGRYKGASLRYIEGLTEVDGSIKCIGPEDGWAFVFSVPAMGSVPVILGGCRNKTMFTNADLGGAYKGIFSYREIPGGFKDSLEAAAVLPTGCAGGRSTLIMKLRNFKPAAAPITGHSFVWEADCGGQKYYVDAQTGRYLGRAGDNGKE